MIQPEKSDISRIPGSTPAMKRCVIGTSAATPYTIMMIDGGMRMPSVPDPASDPSTSLSS